MSDRSAFERQIEAVLQQAAGSSRPVDASAVAGRATRRPSKRITATTRWLSGGVSPGSTEGGFSMFSALKLVAGGAVLALFGGLLLTLGVVGPADDSTMPAAPTATEEVSTSSGSDGFPTGLLVANDDYGGRYLEFHEDGTGMYFEHPGSFEVPFRYGVSGDVWTEMTHDSPLSSDRQVPATYHWTWDGEFLSFELWGEELNPGTRGATFKSDFRLLPGSRVVVVPFLDLPAGEAISSVLLSLDIVPAADVDPEAFTSRADVVSHTTAVAIEQGQVITPDLLEPAE